MILVFEYYSLFTFPMLLKVMQIFGMQYIQFFLEVINVIPHNAFSKWQPSTFGLNWAEATRQQSWLMPFNNQSVSKGFLLLLVTAHSIFILSEKAWMEMAVISGFLKLRVSCGLSPIQNN